jgi:hypothetical protein
MVPVSILVDADLCRAKSKNTNTVILSCDTAGFGDDLLKEEKTIDDLVNVLKNEIKHVHVFILAFKQTDNRMTYALRSMISLFEKGTKEKIRQILSAGKICQFVTQQISLRKYPYDFKLAIYQVSSLAKNPLFFSVIESIWLFNMN